MKCGHEFLAIGQGPAGLGLHTASMVVPFANFAGYQVTMYAGSQSAGIGIRKI